MNTKRQTIWLVSMLSLMVVLSAYYLFTQDMNDANKLSEVNGPEQNVTEVAGGEKGIIVEEVLQSNEDGKASAINEQILKQLEKEGFPQGGLFSELLVKREQKNEAEQNRIMSVLADVGKDAEESAAAFAEMEQLEEKNSRIQSLESALMEQYQIAMISEENERYKVVVTSEKLEKKDAASIIDQVMTVMEVKADQVSVQYVPEP